MVEGTYKSKAKTYPFSVMKHQHDIEFRFNRVSNILHDINSGEIQADKGQIDQLEVLKERLDELRNYVFGSYPLCYLPGNMYGLAVETVAWASQTRDETQASKRTENN